MPSRTSRFPLSLVFVFCLAFLFQNCTNGPSFSAHDGGIEALDSELASIEDSALDPDSLRLSRSQSADFVSSAIEAPKCSPRGTTLLLPPAPTNTGDCKNPPDFNVKKGCPYRRLPGLKAKGDGIQDDAPAVQQCLLAAGDFYRRCHEPHRNRAQLSIPVHFPSGTYFVEGKWQTLFPYHGRPEASRYEPHWVSLALPRGVSIVGENVDSTTLTIRKRNDTRPTGPSGKRSGSFMIVAGFEKSDAYCKQALFPRGFRPPLCDLPFSERIRGGAHNTINRITLLGDFESEFANTQIGSSGLPTLRAHSSALQIWGGQGFRANNIRIKEWYRGLHAWQTNGVSIHNSFFVDNLKAGLYINPPSTPHSFVVSDDSQPQGVKVVSCFYSPLHFPTVPRLGQVIEGNDFQMSPEFLRFFHDRTILSRKFDPGMWSAFTGLYMAGNHTSHCEQISARKNSFRYSKLWLETLCPRPTLIEENSFRFVRPGIRIGGNDPNSGQGAGFSRVFIRNNRISQSLLGIDIIGCNGLGSIDGRRCSARKSDHITIQGNIMTDFLPMTGPGSDPYVRHVSGVRSNIWQGGIVLQDASGVEVIDNAIVGMREGSQFFGIGAVTSDRNIRPSTSPVAHCYGPKFYSENLTFKGNLLRYRPFANDLPRGFGTAEPPLGLYLENAFAKVNEAPPASWPFDLKLDDQRQPENRLVNAGIGRTEAEPRFHHQGVPYCVHRLNHVSTDCRRLMIDNQHWMSTSRLARMASGAYRSNVSSAASSVETLYGYCLRQMREGDAEIPSTFPE